MKQVDPHELVQALTDNGWRLVSGGDTFAKLARPTAEIVSRYDDTIMVPFNPAYGDFEPLMQGALAELADAAEIGMKAAQALAEVGIDLPTPKTRRPLFVPASVESTCDNTSVGALIFDDLGRMLMFERVKPPVGVAPPCGHIDEHGTAEDAIRAEVNEEVGLTVVSLNQINRTGGWRNNICRRHPGPRGFGHNWTLFDVKVTGEMQVGQAEAKNARWADCNEINRLATRTAALAHGRITATEYADNPGLEPVWIDMLASQGIVTGVTGADLEAIAALYTTSPWPQP